MKRPLFIVSTVFMLAISLNAYAQHKGTAFDKPVGELTEAERQELFRESEERARAYRQKLRSEQSQINQSIDKLSSEREPLAAKIEFFNNVKSLRTRDDADKWVDEARKEWDAEVGPRIRIRNPYND